MVRKKGTDISSDHPVIRPSDSPHYHGHRDRLRERFVEGGAEILQDYEMMELLLFLVIPMKDVKPLAKDLIARFGTLNGVLNAPLEELQTVKGLSRTSAIGLKSIQAAGHRLLKQEIQQKPTLNNWARLLDYCQATMAHETVEHFRILFLNRRNELIADEIQQTGTVDHAPVYPREVVKRALALNASAMILCHNHPSGDPTPSQDDITMTDAIIAAATPMGIAVHDHIIVSKNGVKSFKKMQLL
jgi:DNA repair protein RadC